MVYRLTYYIYILVGIGGIGVFDVFVGAYRGVKGVLVVLFDVSCDDQ